MLKGNSGQSISELSFTDNCGTLISKSKQLLFEKFDNIGERVPQEVSKIKGRIQSALIRNLKEFKV